MWEDPITMQETNIERGLNSAEEGCSLHVTWRVQERGVGAVLGSRAGGWHTEYFVLPYEVH